MSKLYLMVGIPGSGKSTFAKQHKEMVVVSSDEVRKDLWGSEEDQRDPIAVFNEVDRRVRQALAEGHDVIYDATNIKPKTRKAIVKKFGVETIAVFMNTPIAECMRRNAERNRHVPNAIIDQMARRLVPPTKAEGFIEIIEIGG